MIRTSTTVLGALLLLLVHRSSESTTSVSTTSSLSSTTHSTPSLPIPTPSPSTHPTPPPSSTHPTPPPSSSHTSTPSPTGIPIPTGKPARNEYILYSTDYIDKETKVCLRMLSKMAVQFDYSTTTDEVESVVMPLEAAAAVNINGSYCKLTVCAEPTTAILVIDYLWLTVTLRFNELEGNEHWSYNSTTVSYQVDKQLFKNLKNEKLYGEMVTVTSKDSLFDWTIPSLQLQHSYVCLANSTVEHFNNSIVNDVIKVSLLFGDLQVQVFRFTKNGKFDKTENCYADQRIVVPVAVAAALALLACSVLVFSLIKMLWNKCKERSPAKYQHLSSRVN